MADENPDPREAGATNAHEGERAREEMTDAQSGHFRIKDMDDKLRPRERLEAHGADALSTAELLAILLRTGVKGCNAVEVGMQLIRTHGTLENLARSGVGELRRTKGLGQAKAVTLAAAFGLGRRLKRELAHRAKIDQPERVYEMMGEEMRALSKEVVRVLVLNTRCELLRIEDVARGSVNESIAHPRDILLPMFTHSAHSFVLVHNHPSGDPSPSEADRRLTRRLAEAAQLLQLNFLDHVIIGSPDGTRLPYFSFKEAGLL